MEVGSRWGIAVRGGDWAPRKVDAIAGEQSATEEVKEEEESKDDHEDEHYAARRRESALASISDGKDSNRLAEWTEDKRSLAEGRCRASTWSTVATVSDDEDASQATEEDRLDGEEALSSLLTRRRASMWSTTATVSEDDRELLTSWYAACKATIASEQSAADEEGLLQNGVGKLDDYDNDGDDHDTWRRASTWSTVSAAAREDEDDRHIEVKAAPSLLGRRKVSAGEDCFNKAEEAQTQGKGNEGQGKKAQEEAQGKEREAAFVGPVRRRLSSLDEQLDERLGQYATSDSKQAVDDDNVTVDSDDSEEETMVVAAAHTPHVLSMHADGSIDVSIRPRTRRPPPSPPSEEEDEAEEEEEEEEQEEEEQEEEEEPSVAASIRATFRPRADLDRLVTEPIEVIAAMDRKAEELMARIKSRLRVQAKALEPQAPLAPLAPLASLASLASLAPGKALARREAVEFAQRRLNALSGGGAAPPRRRRRERTARRVMTLHEWLASTDEKAAGHRGESDGGESDVSSPDETSSDRDVLQGRVDRLAADLSRRGRAIERRPFLAPRKSIDDLVSDAALDARHFSLEAVRAAASPRSDSQTN